MQLRQRERGFALVAALWAAIILAIVVASVQQLSWADAKQTRASQTLAQINETADAAVTLILLRMMGTPDVQPPVDGTPFEMALDGSVIRASVQDESGRIDLNLASESALRQLMSFAGLGPEEAEVLADRVLDWREPTLNPRINGAKAAEYHAAGLAYGPRNGPFRSVSELRMVLGVTDELYRRLAPMLTVYSQEAWIDPDFAPDAVLQMIASSDASARATLRRRSEDRLEGTQRSVRYGAIPGHAFSITAELSGPGTARVQRTVIVRLTGHAEMPVWVYRWS